MNFCFDCDDTLYDMRQPFDAACLAILPDLRADPEEFYVMTRQLSDEVFHLVQEGAMTVDESGAWRIQEGCRRLGQPISPEQAQAFQQAYRQAQNDIRMDPVLETWLSGTCSGLWILSNGPDEHQRRKFAALDTKRFFPENHTFTSGQIGYAKPDRRAFEAVTDQPEDFWYIGDNYVNDMEGAKALGWHTIHFNRRHQESGPAADYAVYTESELTALLRQLEGEKHV
ncbi:HAD family hydrolase [uncultured Faecalibaculum sp.]|uniref:HAD family hydrolase n=2 Tax=uncultured Faecalibaculum sp. TaxID=1729681 RepID=UPI0025F04880|nr:HAD family hydrolase [uncultured Faecalibaculum sp.]